MKPQQTTVKPFAPIADATPDREQGKCKCGEDCPCREKKVRHKTRAKQNAPKTFLTIVFTLMMTVPALAQDTAAPSFWSDPFNHPMTPVYFLLGGVGLTVILILITIIYLVRIINLLVRETEKARAAKEGVQYVPRPSFFEKIWDDLNASVPVSQEKDIDMGHSFDGIRELDNHLPPWWKGLFYGCIIWGIGYLIVYHVTDSLPLSEAEYHEELAVAREKARMLAASRPAEAIDENTLTYNADPERIAKGQAVFNSNNCGSCHRQDGGGNTIGPNLTDAYWLHGGSVQNIFRTISIGVVEKGMPAWGKVMSAADVRDVTFYVMSLQGSEPRDAKGPQGEFYKPDDSPVKPDSTTAIAN